MIFSHFAQVLRPFRFTIPYSVTRQWMFALVAVTIEPSFKVGKRRQVRLLAQQGQHLFFRRSNSPAIIHQVTAFYYLCGLFGGAQFLLIFSIKVCFLPYFLQGILEFPKIQNSQEFQTAVAQLNKKRSTCVQRAFFRRRTSRGASQRQRSSEFCAEFSRTKSADPTGCVAKKQCKISLVRRCPRLKNVHKSSASQIYNQNPKKL